MPTQKPRYTIIVDDELLKQIDDFRFENRYPSRSAATLDLIRLGMKELKKQHFPRHRLQLLQQISNIIIKSKEFSSYFSSYAVTC